MFLPKLFDLLCMAWGIFILILAVSDLVRRRYAFRSPKFNGLLLIIMAVCFAILAYDQKTQQIWLVLGLAGAAAGFTGGLIYFFTSKETRKGAHGLRPGYWTLVGISLLFWAAGFLCLGYAMHQSYRPSESWLALAGVGLLFAGFLVALTVRQKLPSA
ncbi:MAG: hypothetical protein P8Z49_00270 [Acidobacteriota bacterium]|jgi:hypothetical protein